MWCAMPLGAMHSSALLKSLLNKSQMCLYICMLYIFNYEYTICFKSWIGRKVRLRIGVQTRAEGYPNPKQYGLGRCHRGMTLIVTSSAIHTAWVCPIRCLSWLSSADKRSGIVPAGCGAHLVWIHCRVLDQPFRHKDLHLDPRAAVIVTFIAGAFRDNGDRKAGRKKKKKATVNFPSHPDLIWSFLDPCTTSLLYPCLSREVKVVVGGRTTCT
jgi:hypothetical protein